MDGLSFKRDVHHMLLLITLLIVIGDVAMLLISRSVGNTTASTYADLSDSWYETGNFGVSDEPISHTINLKKNSSYFVYINLPEDFPIKSRSCISFISYACSFDVTVDGNIIYSYGKDFRRNHKMIPRRTHYIPIPEDAVSRDVKISFMAGRDGGSVLTDGSYFGEIDVLSRTFTIKRGYAFILCAFFITFGALLIILALLTGMGRVQIAFPTIAQALLLINLGVYISSYNDTLLYVVRNDVICTFVEYTSLFMIPLFMQLVIISNRKKHVNWLALAVTAADILIVVAGVILHYTDTIHLITYSNYVHIWMGIHGIYTLVWLRNISVKERKSSHSYLYADAAMETIDYGILSLLVLSLINLILWNRGIYHLDFLNSEVKGNFIILGALIFAGCVILSYLYHSLGAAHEHEIKQSLTDAAYTDELTGLSNRAYCDNLIGQGNITDWNGSLAFLDLDGLKTINDTLGHEAGDNYIKAFASTIRGVFSEEVVICRMGGDEFLIILSGYDNAACAKAVDDITAAVDSYNEAHRDMPILFSVGFASSDTDNIPDPLELFRLADERMYVMKDEHHRQGKGGRS